MNREPSRDGYRSTLLLIGTPRFHNPRHNIVNLEVPNVMTQERQNEFDEIVDRLASFAATHVAVVWPTFAQEKLDLRYADYRAGRSSLAEFEVDQVGLRLAARLDLPRVNAVDWNGAHPGAARDYDFQAWLRANDRSDEFDAWLKPQLVKSEETTLRMNRTPISSWLRWMNSPQERHKWRAQYYEISQFGDEQSNPGAAYAGAFFARNLRILNNLARLSSEPGARIAAVYGAGNAALLEQQALESGFFTVADTIRYLPTGGPEMWEEA